MRLNEVKKNHDFIMEKLKQKYEYNYKRNNNNKDTNKKSEENITSSDMSDSSEFRNKTQTNSDFEKWYDKEKIWQKMRDMKLNIIKSELEENKICQDIYNKKQETFKPKINKNCENLLLKKYDGDFYLRLKDYYILDENKLVNAKKDLCILHPLPRVNEISTDVDDDERAKYFLQAYNGVYIRMALILKLLEVK